MIKYVVLSLGEILSNENYDENLIINAFEKFSCSREKDLENFLIRKSIQYEKTNYGKTYLLIDADVLNDGELSIIAYFTIAQISVDISSLSNKKRRKVLGEHPGRDSLNSVPAYLVGQLGRNDTYTNNDITGEEILNECYNAISIAARAVGGKLLILECREHMYGKFYENQGFNILYDNLNDNNLYTLYKKMDFSIYWNR